MERYLHAVYCDDVRLEIGNKQSLMGIYGEALVISEMPASIPKLCVVVTVVTPSSRPFEKLVTVIKKDDEVLVEAPLAEELANEISERARVRKNEMDSEERILRLNAAFILSPLLVEAPCTLRVRAYTESEELKCPALRIIKSEALSAKSEG
jgi:hypothetical protein